MRFKSDVMDCDRMLWIEIFRLVLIHKIQERTHKLVVARGSVDRRKYHHGASPNIFLSMNIWFGFILVVSDGLKRRLRRFGSPLNRRHLQVVSVMSRSTTEWSGHQNPPDAYFYSERRFRVSWHCNSGVLHQLVLTGVLSSESTPYITENVSSHALK